MSTFDLFVEEFKARVIIKANQGQKARLVEFDTTVCDVASEHGAIPDIARIRGYFAQCLSKKTNWGCREVPRVFEGAVFKLRGHGRK